MNGPGNQPGMGDQGSLDLSFLDDMLGVQAEMVPVEGFFDAYVETLTMRSKRHAEQGGAGPQSKHHRGSPGAMAGPFGPLPMQLPSHLQAPAGGLAALNLGQNMGLGGPLGHMQGLGMGGAMDLAPMPLGGALPAVMASGTLSVGSEQLAALGSGTLPAGVGSGPLPAGLRTLAAGSGPAGAAALHFPPGKQQLEDLSAGGSGGAWPGRGNGPNGACTEGGSSGMVGGQAEEEEERSPGHTAAHDGQPRRKISKKKQESNKAAQQRYRERKKAQFNEMEEKLSELAGQVQRMAALEDRNRLLEAQNTDLESKLVEREQEIERLKLTLDRYAEEGPLGDVKGGACAAAGGGPTAAAAEGGHGEGGGGGSEEGECVPCDVLPRDLAAAAGEELKGQVSEQVARLREFMEEHSLMAVLGDPSGPALPEPLMRQLVQLVGRTCQLCQAAIRAEGVRVLDLIDREPSDLSEGEAVAERWRRVLGALRLAEAQAQQLLLLRDSHLAKMRAIYEERQRLNLEAMSLMLPQPGRHPSVDDNTVEGRVGGLSSGGYLAVARSSQRLGAVLDKIKDNLRREQRAVMDLNCTCVSRILSPLQAAVYMTESYPHHCDALALSNVLAEEMAEVETPLATAVPAKGAAEANK